MKKFACVVVYASVSGICTSAAGQTAGEKMAVSDSSTDVPSRTTIEEVDIEFTPAHPGEEPPQMSGWPIDIAGNFNFAPVRGVLFHDLDGDGDLEIITSSTDSKIYAWHHDGATVAGFPVTTIGMCQYPPSIADLDGDGDPEIVQTTRGLTSGGRLYAIDHQGQALSGFPKNINNNNVSFCATLFDLDGDGDREIIVGERDYPIGRLHIYEYDGTEWGDGWPVEMDHVPTMTASVGDVDNDGEPEIFYVSYNSMYLFALDGSVESGWPRQIPNANFSYQSAALVDLDDDNDLEIVVGAHRDAAGVYAFHHDGNPVSGWPKLTGTWTYCAPTVTDLEGDGVLEIISGRAGFVSGSSACFWAWDGNGNTRNGFPFVSDHGGGSEGPLTVADIDGDGRMEIFADHNIMIGGEGFLFGVDADGNDLPGFPLRTPGFTYLNGATIGDVDLDGDYELGVLVANREFVQVRLYDLPDQFERTDKDWPTYHARNSRGGLNDPPAEGVPATLTALTMVDGTLVSGGIAELETSDDIYVETEARVTGEVAQPHLMIMRLNAATEVENPTSIDITIEGRITDLEAQTTLRLRDFANGGWDQVDQYSMGMSEEIFTTNAPDAGDYVRSSDGRIRLEVEQIVFFPFTLGGFHTLLDHIEIMVR